jgi:Zn-dependent alcohol dehydrogenase
VEGCKAAGASRIIGVDITNEKLELGMFPVIHTFDMINYFLVNKI